MTRMWLTRHGETVWHEGNRYAGSSDVALNASGRAQAARLAAWASSARPTAVYSSALARSIDTARPASRSAGVEPRIDDRLNEVGFGAGEGLTRAEMRQRFPDEVAAFLAAPGTVPLPGGEPGQDAVRRAMPALNEIAGRHSAGKDLGRRAGAGPGDAGDVLVVMHSTLLRLVLCHLLGIDIDRYRTVFPRVDNVALTAVTRSTGGTWSLERFNVPLPTPARAE